jgi:hypothetical protein
MTLPKAISDAIDAYRDGHAEVVASVALKQKAESVAIACRASNFARAALESAIADHAAATPAPSALERLRDKIRSEADNADESYSAGLHRAADMIDEETMTQRLPDDRLQAIRLMLQEHAASWLHTIDRDTLAAMLDEIEENRAAAIESRTRE